MRLFNSILNNFINMGLLTDDSSIEIKVKANLVDFKKDLNSSKIYARDTKKLLDKELLLELELRRDRFKVELQKAKQDLKKFAAEGNEKMRLKASIRVDELQRGLTESKRNLNNYVNTGEKNLSRLQMKFNGLKKIVSSGLGFLGIAYAIQKVGQAISFSAKTFRDYETAFAGFRKTLNATEPELKAIEKGIIDMSKGMPMSVEGLSKIAELGGQMGIAADDILKFTKVVAQLNTAIDGISAEEASTILARLVAQTGQTIDELDRLGASLVGLGNNFKANEGEILNFANEIKSAGGIIGLTSQDILGISTAFVDAGINAEAGGTAVSKAMLKIDDSVNQGNYLLTRFAEVSGKTKEQFVNDWNTDSANAFASVLEGIKNSGDRANVTIDELFGTDIRLKKAFLAVANSGDTLKKSIETANIEFENGTALQEEFKKRLQTTDSQITINENRWKAWASSFGGDINKIKLLWSNLMLKSIPKGWAILKYTLVAMVVAMQNTWKSIQGITAFAVGNIGAMMGGLIDIFVYLGKTSKTIGYNIGQSFRNLPSKIGEYLNLGIKKLEDFLNKAIDGTNNFAKKFGYDLGLERVTLGTVDFGENKAQYKKIEAYQSTYYTKAKKWTNDYVRQKGYEIDVNQRALEQTQLQFEEQAELASKEKAINNTLSDLKIKNAKSVNKETQKEIKTLNSLQKKLQDLKKDLANQEVGSETFKAIQQEIIKTQAEYDKYTKSLDSKTDSKLIKKTKEELKSLTKELKNINKELDKQNEKEFEKYKKGKKLAQEYYDEIKKKAETAKKKVDELKNKQKELNDELAGLKTDKDKALANRTIELEKELQDLEKQRKSETDPIEKQSLDNEYQKKLKEYNLAKQNTTKESLEEARRISKQTETERILEEYEMKKQELEEKLKLVEENLNKELELYETTVKLKENAEEVFTNFIKIETEKRMSEHEKMLARAREIAREMNELGFNGKGFTATYSKAVSDGEGGTSIIKETKIINYNTVNNDVDVNKIGTLIAREVNKQRKN